MRKLGQGEVKYLAQDQAAGERALIHARAAQSQSQCFVVILMNSLYMLQL